MSVKRYYEVFKKFEPTMTSVDSSSIQQNMLRQWSLPLPLTTRAKEVKVTFEFLRVGEIDTINEKYYGELLIEARWTDTANIDSYDPKYLKIKVIIIESLFLLSLHFNPHLYIENYLSDYQEKISYEVKMCHDNLVKVKEKRYIKGFFWERLELQNFPLDIQELSIVLASKLNTDELELVHDYERGSRINVKALQTFQEQQKWRIYHLVRVNKKVSYEPSARANSTTIDVNQIHTGNLIEKATFALVIGDKAKSNIIVASCYVSRRPGYYVLNAYALIFLLTLISLCIFSIQTTMPQSRLQTCFTLILTSISFKWVINRYLPTVSYATSLDKYALVSIFYLCIVCIWHALIGIELWDAKKARRWDYWAFMAFVVAFVLIHVYFVIWSYTAYRELKRLQRIDNKFCLHKDECDVEFSSFHK